MRDVGGLLLFDYFYSPTSIVFIMGGFYLQQPSPLLAANFRHYLIKL